MKEGSKRNQNKEPSVPRPDYVPKGQGVNETQISREELKKLIREVINEDAMNNGSIIQTLRRGL